ncbi:hypothetical protein OE749_04510 [Aestuariibacter sp. AA17]|uniref:Uncharacterized protein n=1 Tax=Fluctibacter corallii TaxID=2984329 RepID=A0ABT3A5I1_9ALTE|nr:hypothetical protein [Aestuariibacter sp. AA17]MCV2883953.1 hypothetical protein [Aestuariibacter sp. AA17]
MKKNLTLPFNDRCILVCSDIFGATSSFHRFISWLYKQTRQQVEYVSPYDSAISFTEEAAAYTHFKHVGGIDSYIGRLQDKVAKKRISHVIGFSAGASSAFLALTQSHQYQHTRKQPNAMSMLKSITLFYPGQLRHYPELIRTFSIGRDVTMRIVLARESHFDEHALKAQFTQQGMYSECVDAHHGFMNPLSTNSDEIEREKWEQEIVSTILRSENQCLA